MRKILSLAVLAAGLAVGGVAYAQSSSSSGTVGANVGDSMKQPMIVTADNGNVRMQPNATSKILTTVPHGHQVIMVGTDQWRRLGPCHRRRIGWLYGSAPARQGALTHKSPRNNKRENPMRKILPIAVLAAGLAAAGTAYAGSSANSSEASAPMSAIP